MTGICVNCGRRHHVPSYRGSRIKDYHCAECGGDLAGPAAKAAKEAAARRQESCPHPPVRRYTVPIGGRIFCSRCDKELGRDPKADALDIANWTEVRA